MFVLQDDYIRNKYNTSRVEFIQGHIKTIGRMANKIKNPIWKIHNENGDNFIIMYCEVDTLCTLCPISYQKILDYEKLHPFNQHGYSKSIQLKRLTHRNYYKRNSK